MQQPSAAPNFLTLPPELRHEIYKHLLSFIALPTPLPPNDENWFYPLNRMPRFDLSIFRVNRQIHDEASQVFYSQNNFPVRVTVTGSICNDEGRIRNPQDFRVRHQSFWEDVSYERTINGELRWRSWFRQPRRAEKIKNEDEFTFMPGLRYRRLIRRVHVAIYDLRTSAYLKLWPDEEDEELRKQTRTIMITSMCRIKHMIGQGGSSSSGSSSSSGATENAKAGQQQQEQEQEEEPRKREKTEYNDRNGGIEKVKVDISIHPKSLHPRSPALAWVPKLTPEDVDALHIKFLKELACTAWPFTVPRWQYSLNMVHPAERRFTEVKDAALEECGDNITAAEEKWYRELKMQGDTWAIYQKLLVVNSEGSPTWG